jgi:hypothetical protein
LQLTRLRKPARTDTSLQRLAQSSRTEKLSLSDRAAHEYQSDRDQDMDLLQHGFPRRLVVSSDFPAPSYYNVVIRKTRVSNPAFPVRPFRFPSSCIDFRPSRPRTHPGILRMKSGVVA